MSKTITSLSFAPSLEPAWPIVRACRMWFLCVYPKCDIFSIHPGVLLSCFQTYTEAWTFSWPLNFSTWVRKCPQMLLLFSFLQGPLIKMSKWAQTSTYENTEGKYSENSQQASRELTNTLIRTVVIFTSCWSTQTPQNEQRTQSRVWIQLCALFSHSNYLFSFYSFQPYSSTKQLCLFQVPHDLWNPVVSSVTLGLNNSYYYECVYANHEIHHLVFEFSEKV